MTTTDISLDPALHVDKESDTRQVLDLVLYRQIGTFSALEIANVAELLPSWICSNIGAITSARADDTRDWYFPVYARTAISTRPGASSSWSGTHHLAENQASATVQPLPTLPALPLAWENTTIVASGGGLLLLVPPVHPIPSEEDGDVVRACTAGGSAGLQTRSRLRYAESQVPQDWKPLLVWNPLTGTWRALSVPPENRSFLQWRYDEVLIDMIVDEQANSYTIVMTFRKSFCMCVYKSTTDNWAHYQYNALARLEMAWGSDICANAVVGGGLHYAFIEFGLRAPTRVILRVHEINFETGEWKSWRQYLLRVQVWDFLLPFFDNRRIEREPSEILRHLGLVECMGVIYAVIPTRKEETINSINNNNFALVKPMWNVTCSLEDGFEEMPVQFHILGLNCENTFDVHGMLRIHVPEDRNDLPLRRTSLVEKTSSSHFSNRNWFSCTAKGRVIWVACEDYLLQYDVTSGR